jgi:hypothetical protein
MKLDLLTNATVVDDATRFVSQKAEEKLKPSDNSNEDEKESREPDYDEDEDQIEEEQEDGSDQITTATTTNEVF